MYVVVYGYIGMVVNLWGKCLSSNVIVFWECEGEDVVVFIYWIIK